VQDTVDALENVRQLFVNGCIHSGFFHRFTCTVHSPVGRNPRTRGVAAAASRGPFAKNEWASATRPAWTTTASAHALRKALYNSCTRRAEEDVRVWFEEEFEGARVPRPTVGGGAIASALRTETRYTG